MPASDLKLRKSWTIVSLIITSLVVLSIYNLSSATISPTIVPAYPSSKGYTEGAGLLLEKESSEKKTPDSTPYSKQNYIENLTGLKKITYTLKQAENEKVSSSQKPTVLIVSSVGKDEPYGPGRSFELFMDTILTLIDNTDSKYQFSLGLQNNHLAEFNKIESHIAAKLESLATKFHKITLSSAPQLEGEGVSRNDRHNDAMQRTRRRLIARSRNFLISQALADEQYIITLDSDIIGFEQGPKMLEIMINSNRDIIVPRVTRGGISDYDRNSWRGKRTKPLQEELDLMDANKWGEFRYVPRDVQGEIYHFYMHVDSQLTDEQKQLNYAVPLDSVGGAVLFFKSIVFKQGANFPTSYIIGTTWDRSEGYDGIETEGLCYLAKPLGYSCWGMPNLVAYHIP
ncbi:hypothetical protein LELG_04934 [Lodderomyces elongisporus NRRL YB-4239]|uniref:Uncharacterized protein n=1 Tax=Lodderomyces elongisporus (strain ATCC 11503 / CBS 2605 / JCM 1781 / NBRC 1676 / NRRL YB-4239) TaxID=379508 RepID=A5E5P5_LODEL|nr:hypothetical protein LELG_04934 [Lodderomyces elongisporus NRRL YB-4239]